MNNDVSAAQTVEGSRARELEMVMMADVCLPLREMVRDHMIILLHYFSYLVQLDHFDS